METIDYTRDHAFGYGKRQLIDILTREDFTPDTYTTYKDEMESYLRYLGAVCQLPDRDHTQDNKDDTHEPNNEREKESESGTDNALIGVFQKNLSGGVIKNEKALRDGLLFIGETWTRNAGLSDGDLVEVLDYNYDDHQASGICLHKQQEPDDPQDIQLFQFGLIDSMYTAKHTQPLDASRPFIITESVNGDALNFAYQLSEEDIKRFNIAKGDVVDLAWYANNPKTCRVIWKHKTDYETSETIEQKRLHHTSEKEDTPPPSNVFTDNQFDGLTICLLGMDMYRDKFRQEVEKRGGSLIHVDPKSSRTRREAEYCKSDMVVIALQQTSHEASNHAIAFAKQEGLSYGSFNGHGVGPFILEIISRLNLSEKSA